MDRSRADQDSGSLKRKRSRESERSLPTTQPPYEHTHYSRLGADNTAAVPTPPPATSSLPRPHNHVQINYLARQYNGDLPLVSSEDTLPSILNILNSYSAVIDRQESMAGNMGARPLGPILMKRFERIFDGPPKMLSSHDREDTITWLDVVDFAQNTPDQFSLTQLVDGSRVCQFYTKQCRVQISEEDFFLINSGMPQKLIPPQPIAEDEEKELGTLEIIEKNIIQITQLADQVAVRARQFNHRLRGRKHAILERRAADAAVSGVAAIRASSPSNVALINGGSASESPVTGFMAVNSRQNLELLSSEVPPVSQSTYNELMKSLFTLSQKRAGADSSLPASAVRHPRMSVHESEGSRSTYYGHQSPNSGRATQSYSNSVSRGPGAEDEGPFKAEMVAHLETLGKGNRIEPPCDRCRRLHMDCLKNLTACMGCTKKHAKCSWKDVKDEELRPEYKDEVSLEQDRQYTPAIVRYRQEHQSSYPNNELEDHIAHQRAAHSMAIAAMDKSLGQDDEASKDSFRYRNLGNDEQSYRERFSTTPENEDAHLTTDISTTVR